MITRNLQIVNKLGLHARAASVFVKTASSFAAEIAVRHADKKANGKSIMSMMLLQAAHGTQIELTISGEDEIDAMDAIQALVEDRFGESE